MTNKNNFLPILIGGSLLILTFTSGAWVLLSENKKNPNSFVDDTNVSANNFVPTLTPTTAFLPTNVVTSTAIPANTLVPTTQVNQPNITNIPTPLPVSTTSISKTAIITTAPVVRTSTSTPIPTRTPIPATNTLVPTPSPTSAPTYTYKNGTYSVTGSYSVPGGSGPQSMKIVLTISNDLITNASAVPMATDGESYNYQQNFASGINGKVSGHTLDYAATIARVNGASLTTNYFKNSAVANIKSQAKN